MNLRMIGFGLAALGLGLTLKQWQFSAIDLTDQKQPKFSQKKSRSLEVEAWVKREPINSNPASTPQSPKIQTTSRTPQQFLPAGPREAVIRANFYSKTELQHTQAQLAQLDPTECANLLISILAQETFEQGLLRDKVMFFAASQRSADMTEFWTKILDRDFPRDQEERYQLTPKKTAIRNEAIDLAVMEQLQAIDGLSRSAEESADAKSILWDVVLEKRQIPFASDLQRLEAVRGLSQLDGNIYLKLSKILDPNDSLRPALAAIAVERLRR